MTDTDSKELEHYRKLKKENRLIELIFPLDSEVWEIRQASCTVDPFSGVRSGLCPYIDSAVGCTKLIRTECPMNILRVQATLKNQMRWEEEGSLGRTVFDTWNKARDFLIKDSLRQGKHLDM